MNKLYPYHRLSILIAFLVSLTFSVSAQELAFYKGVVFKKNSPVTIALVSVKNLSRKNLEVVTDDVGAFRIQAAIGDTLLFRKDDYTPQIIVIQNYSPLSVYLQAVIHLNQVTVKETSQQKAMQDVMDNYKKKGQYYTLDPSVMSVLKSPLTGLYELFGKSPEQARKFRQYTKEENERIEVARRYNRTLVKKITNMPDEDLEDFMFNFTPNIEDIRVWNDYDIVSYIKRSYAYFKDNRNDYKIQKLN
ncbi:hypothetical protein ACFS5N_07855 [Mucilaginibacter ximonensis]|uniref:Carboxypeptidase-like protein n=1 Tax=Mucilaginibacter ximonensis TaxID=538021 RepID=A0ABW5YBL8_9SPHI